MIAFDTGDVHFPHDVEALFGIGIVTDDVTQAHVVGTFLLFDILKDNLESVQVGMDIRNNGELHFTLPCYFKSARVIFGLVPEELLVPNKMLEARFSNCSLECQQFILLAFGNQLDAAIGQVPNTATDLKSRSDGFNSITKPDALHVPGVKNLHSAALHNNALSVNVPQQPSFREGKSTRMSARPQIKPYRGGVRNDFF
jgi:hypothetical protein